MKRWFSAAQATFERSLCWLLPLLLLILCSSSPLLAQDPLPEAPETFAAESVKLAAASGGLTPVDWGIIILYAVSTLVMGWYFSRKQESTQEYFVGNRNMNSMLIGVSLFATLLSTITYLSTPGEILGRGPGFLTRLLATPFVFALVGFVLLPVYMRQRVTSAYELLEEKLGLGFRLMGAGMFLFLRLIWMSLLTYLTAKAMTVMMGVDDSWIPGIVLVTGFVAVIYTSLGGLRAVVITDLIQTTLLFGGALLILAVITYDYGGFGWFPTVWQPNWDHQPLISFDPKVRVSILGTILSIFIWDVCTAGGDQVSVQRFMATRDAAAARRALLTQMGVNIAVCIVLSLVGLALLGYFQANPGQLPAHMTIERNADDLFPRFIAFHLPVGISGLVVAAMFAAAMSSIDSGVNSITAVVMTDFVDRFGYSPKTERGHVLTARLLAFGIGGLIVIGSSFVGKIEGNITVVASKTANLLTTPIFGLFFYALFMRSPHRWAVCLGTLTGVLTAGVIAFSGALVLFLNQQFQVNPAVFNTEILTRINPLTQQSEFYAVDPISFLWIGPISLTLNLLIGLTLSPLFHRWFPHATVAKPAETTEDQRGSCPL